MQNSNLYFTIFQKIYEHLTILLNVQSKKKAGRPPKVSDLQLAALYITSYISNTPILTLARFLICPSIQSWHLFRKSKSERRRITIIMTKVFTMDFWLWWFVMKMVWFMTYGFIQQAITR
jgi:hypothetical protein